MKEKLKYGANEAATDDNINDPRYIRITDFGENGFLRESTFKSLTYEKAAGYFLKEGDLLFARSGATVGKTFLFKGYEGRACYAGYLIKATPNKKIIVSEFLNYYTKSIVYNDWKNYSTIQATIQNISAEKYNTLTVTLPTISEQTQIVNYLDQATTKIDKKIDLLTQKIKHYQDLKTALINRAVTKGLDDSVEMKDSGVEWIGEIPKHWEVKRFKDSFYLRKDTVGENSDDYTLLSLTQNGVIERDMENLQGKFPASFDTYQIVEEEDLIFCLFDMDVTPRTVGYSNFHGMITGAYTVLKTHKDLVKEYFYWLFLSADEGKKLRRNYTGLRSTIKKDTFLSMSVSFPPQKEQQEIVSYLNQKTSTIDKIITTITTQIEHQKELRKTLINDVVTGKVKVENN